VRGAAASTAAAASAGAAAGNAAVGAEAGGSGAGDSEVVTGALGRLQHTPIAATIAHFPALRARAMADAYHRRTPAGRASAKLPRMRRTGTLATVLVLAAAGARAESGTLPKNSYGPDKLYQLVSPSLSSGVKHNQSSVVNGWLFLAGNAKHELWDIHDPTHPELVSKFVSPHSDGEAESHSVSLGKRGDSYYAVTISGKGIDFWDLTNAAQPKRLSSLELEGIDYGDNTNAVWGVYWQGRYVWVGGTNTGLHVVDAADLENPTVVKRLPTSELGGVSAGPLFALGNLLVVTTPKETAGVATLDIGDPENPALLDFEIPEGDSYIGGFYGKWLYLLTPFRTYDVTSDPSNITLLGTQPSPKSEYLNFGDGFMFLGALRPNPGVHKLDLSDPAHPLEIAKIEGRKDKLGGAFTDDQFPLPIGNLLVMSDDEVSIGSVIAVHDTAQDSVPPEVLYVNPKDGATAQPTTTRIGIAFSDQIDNRSLTPSSVVVRPLGGAPLSGSFGHTHTLVSFWPNEPLLPNTSYEIVVTAGGVTDLSQNAVTQQFSSVFSTGDQITAPTCKIAPTTHTPVGQPAKLTAVGSDPGATLEWDFGDGSGSGPSTATEVTHVYATPGRHAVTLSVTLDGATRSCTALQIAHRELAPAPPSRSSSVAFDPTARRVWTVNPDADTVTAVGADDFAVVTEVAVGDRPRTLALAPDGSIWVACQASDEIVVLEADGELGATIPLAWGSAPFGIAFAPDGSKAWVTLDAKGMIAELDPETRALTRTFDLGAGAASIRALALGEDRAYAARFRAERDRGIVYELSPADGAITKEISLGVDPGPDETTSGRGVPNSLGAIALSPDGQRLFVPAKKDNTERGLARDGLALNTDNTVRTIVSFVDVSAGSEDPATRADLDNHDMASAVVASPVGDLVFVASQGTNHVDVLDAYTGKLVAGFATGQAPQGLALTDDGKLFVQSFMSRSLDVYDVSGLLAGTDGAAKRLAEVPTVADEPLTPSALFGKQIFYNAADPRMSLDGYLSCATCHPDDGEDGRVWDFSDRGEGLRNTIALFGRAGTRHGPVHWTANFDEIQDFENDIRFHFGGGGFMTDEDFEADTRSDPLGSSKAGVSEALDALAAYVASLDRFPRSPHRNPDGSRTAQAELGASLFASLDCTSCHRGQKLTDSAPGRLHDVGTIQPSSGDRLGEPLTGLDTPTLRGLWGTAPYLHDGSAETLHDVIDNPAHGNAAGLPQVQKDQLVQFLLQLENEELDLEAEPDRSPHGGCACSSAGAKSSSHPGLLLGLLLLSLRRRRR
jgi:MYXO-CTERM domain-containing protein